MARPQESTVVSILSKNDRDMAIRGALEKAWQTVAERHPDIAWFRRKTTHANLVWEYAVKFAIEALEGDSGVQVLDHNDTISFVFDFAVLVRLKKADIELSTSNYPTQTALAFDNPEADLFGYTGIQRVKAAYVPNAYGTEIDWIGIVAHESGELILKYEISRVADVRTHRADEISEKSTGKRMLKRKNQSEAHGESDERKGV